MTKIKVWLLTLYFIVMCMLYKLSYYFSFLNKYICKKVIKFDLILIEINWELQAGNIRCAPGRRLTELTAFGDS